MANEKYIPAGSEPIRKAQEELAARNARYRAEKLEERDRAAETLLDRIHELGELGVEQTQFEIVRPLGRLATIAHLMNPARTESVIRADTIRIYGRTHDYAQRHALLLPRQGYLLPPEDEAHEGHLQEVLFPDGSTGDVMRWDDYSKGPALYIGWSPPSKAYWCTEYGGVKFSPRHSEDHFAPRNCTPVWGESLRSLSDKYPYAIKRLTRRVDALATLALAEKIVDDSSL